jgi:hypothetical protein
VPGRDTERTGQLATLVAAPRRQLGQESDVHTSSELAALQK